jgi:recombination protein RecT
VTEEKKTDALAPMNGLLSMVEKQESLILDTIPKHVTPERWMRVIRTAIQTTPTLWSTTPQSIMESIMEASNLGLEPNGPLGDSYLVPFRNSKTGSLECQLIIAYRGYIELADRTGKVASMDAQIVRNGDVFEYEYGTSAHIRHVPKLGVPKEKEPEGVLAVYAIVNFLNGTSKFVILSVDEVEEIRACSKAKDGPAWKKWWGEMAKKTAIRRLIKYVRLSPELTEASVREEALDAGLRPGQSLDSQDRMKSATDGNTDALKQRLAGAANVPPPTDEDGVVLEGEFTVEGEETNTENVDVPVSEDAPTFNDAMPDGSPEPTLPIDDQPEPTKPWDPAVFGTESVFFKKVLELRMKFAVLAESLGLSVDEATEKWRARVMEILGSEGCSTMEELDQKQKNAVVKALASALKRFEEALDKKQNG